MAPFAMKSWMEGQTTIVEMVGALNESAQLGEVRMAKTVKIRLEGVTALNSVGTRTWCAWISRFREPVDVILEGCPPIMVKSFSVVKGFLTERCRVDSFVIPFYAEASGEARDFLAVRGVHFDAAGKLNLPQVKDSRGQAMEMDVVAETYLAFLAK